MSFSLEDKLKILDYSDKHSIQETVEAVNLGEAKISDKTI
jgi:hypothetical protein